MTDNVLPPSQSVVDYVNKMGSNFSPPLCQYIYGSRCRGFYHLRSNGTTCLVDSTRTLSSSFLGANSNRATLLDKALDNIVCQNQESVEWRGNTSPLKGWRFDVPEMLMKVIV